MKRFLSLMTFVIILCATVSVPAYASDEKQERVVYDRVGVFTDSEIAEIEAAARIYYADSYASVYVVTARSNFSTGYDGDDFLSEYDISGDGIVLIINDNANRNYNIYPYGKCYSKISDEEYNEILDFPDVYRNIKSGKYKSGAIACIKLCEEACRPNVKGYVIGAAVTIGITVLVFVLCTVYSYKRKLRSEKYPLNRFARLNLNLHRDDFITKFVTVQVIKSSSSSGGGKGGSRGGGRGGR